jgi:hypothetical protein
MYSIGRASRLTLRLWRPAPDGAFLSIYTIAASLRCVDVKLPFAMTGPKTTAGKGVFQMAKVVASGGDLWLADDRHGDGVEIFAVDEKRVPKDSFAHEANLVVERDRAGVVGAHLEFEANPCRKAASSAASSSRKPIPRRRHSATTPIPTEPRWAKAGRACRRMSHQPMTSPARWATNAGPLVLF